MIIIDQQALIPYLVGVGILILLIIVITIMAKTKRKSFIKTIPANLKDEQ